MTPTYTAEQSLENERDFDGEELGSEGQIWVSECTHGQVQTTAHNGSCGDCHYLYNVDTDIIIKGPAQGAVDSSCE